MDSSVTYHAYSPKPRREPKTLPKLPDSHILDVTCGNLKGKLHREMFTCPGIHRECIELEDHTFVTPKKFMYMGEKARLKDWKNAVRISGVQVRKHIEAGHLTFWNHEKMCTGRCQARTANLIKSETLHNNPHPTSYQTPVTLLTTTAENGTMQIQSMGGGDGVNWENEMEEEDIKPDIEQLQLQMIDKMSQAQKQIQSTLSAAAYPDICTETTDEEDRLLWKGIVELGLVDEFFREIKAALDILKNNMVRRMVPLEDTKVISVIVKQLGLMSKLKFKLEAHQIDMEHQRVRLDREMEDLQRKVKEYEQKKEVLKRKSECFTQLLDMTKKDISEPKRACLSNSPSPVHLMFANSMHNHGGGEASNGELLVSTGDITDIVGENHSCGSQNTPNSPAAIHINFENGEEEEVSDNEMGNENNTATSAGFEADLNQVNTTLGSSNDVSEDDPNKNGNAVVYEDGARPCSLSNMAQVRKTSRSRRSTISKDFVSSENIPL